VGENRNDENEEERPLGSADAFGYRRPIGSFSTNLPRLSASAFDAQGFSDPAALTGRMDKPLADHDARRLPDLGMAVKSIIGVWLLYMALVTLRSIVLSYPEFWGLLARRGTAVTAGIVITFFIYLAMRAVRNASLARKAILAGILCLPAALLFSSANYTVFYVIAPLESASMSWEWQAMSPLERAVKSIIESSLSWYFLFAAWAGFYVAMSFARELRLADHRAAVFAREAQEAQLRALRYQINPHFLFNTLNSLSSLVLTKRTETAEQMLMNLSTFFRATLSADPTADVALEEEIKLQRLYLDIEQIRFPDRLTVEIDVPGELLDARVPALILQPVVENAVKYGVAKSRGAVTIRLSAHEEAGRLHIKVKDNGEGGEGENGADGGGTGVGLRNVRERLIARFGDRAGCLYGPDPDGGFTVHLYMPVTRA
jgi:two-component system, LytTR family, sensor kinase